jgi:hypothetical protein
MFQQGVGGALPAGLLTTDEDTHPTPQESIRREHALADARKASFQSRNKLDRTSNRHIFDSLCVVQAAQMSVYLDLDSHRITPEETE